MNANKQDAGGLPATGPFVDRLIRIFRDKPHDDTSALVLLEYGELCRAAPAGGDDFLAKLEARIASEKNKARRWALICFRDSIVSGVEPDSAPAGSGEVDLEEFREAVDLLRITSLGGKRDCERHGTFPHDFDRSLAKADRLLALIDSRAALLRKLQQGADGWIAASERLPERIEGTAHSAEVLVSDGKRVWIHCAYFDWKACERDYWGDTPYVPRLGSGATHWRPLPHASQGQEGE